MPRVVWQVAGNYLFLEAVFAWRVYDLPTIKFITREREIWLFANLEAPDLPRLLQRLTQRKPQRDYVWNQSFLKLNRKEDSNIITLLSSDMKYHGAASLTWWILLVTADIHGNKVINEIPAHIWVMVELQIQPICHLTGPN